MSGDAHVRFCESQGLQYPWPLTYIKKKGKCVRHARKKNSQSKKKKKKK
jgi:hypothetical protein